MARERTGKRTARPRGTSDPIGDRIRELRTGRGLSLQELAGKVEAAPSHIFHIENGDKVPNEELAARIGRALGEDENVYRAWARVRRRTDFHTAAASADVVRRYLMERHEGLPAVVPHPGPQPTRILVPVVAEGEDPGDERRP